MVATATRRPPTACCRCWFRRRCERLFGQRWLYTSVGDLSPACDRCAGFAQPFRVILSGSTTGTAVLEATTTTERTDRQQLLSLSAIAEVLCGRNPLGGSRGEGGGSPRRVLRISLCDRMMDLIEVERVEMTNRSLIWTSTPIIQL